MADVFLSYSRADKAWAAEFAAELAVRGWSVFWDQDIPVGTRYADVIEQELDAAKCVVVLWSKASVSSDWVKAEADEGRARNLLCPVLIEPTRIPLEFRRLQTANLGDWVRGTRHADLDKLLDDIGRVISRETWRPGQARQATPRAPNQQASSARRAALAMPAAVPAPAAQPTGQPSLVSWGMSTRRRESSVDCSLAVVDDERLYVLADDVPGPSFQAGASTTVIQSLVTFFRSFHLDPRQKWPHEVDRSSSLGANLLRVGIKAANDELRSSGRPAGRPPMESTIVALAVGEVQLSISHVGNGRAYRIRAGKIEPLTRDNSMSLGSKDEVQPSVVVETLRSGDTYLLCNEGLWRAVPDDRLLAVIQSGMKIESTCQSLIDAARASDGPNCISAILVRIGDE